MQQGGTFGATIVLDAAVAPRRRNTCAQFSTRLWLLTSARRDCDCAILPVVCVLGVPRHPSWRGSTRSVHRVLIMVIAAHAKESTARVLFASWWVRCRRGLAATGRDVTEKISCHGQEPQASVQSSPAKKEKMTSISATLELAECDPQWRDPAVCDDGPNSDRAAQLEAMLLAFVAAHQHHNGNDDDESAGASASGREETTERLRSHRRELFAAMQRQFGSRRSSCNTALHLLQTLLIETISTSNAITVMRCVNAALEIAYPNIHTRDAFFTRLRKGVCAASTPVDWLQLQMEVIVDRRVRLAKQVHQQQRVADKNHNMMVYRREDIDAAAAALARNPHIYSRIALALLACGARLIEVLRVSKMAIDVQRPATHIRVAGLAKRAGDRVVHRPMWLLSPQQLVDLVRDIQQQVYDDCRRCCLVTNAEISRHYSAGVAKALQRHLPGATTARRCREIYTRITYYLHAAATESAVGWVATVLGHKDGGLQAAPNYTGCEVAGMTKASLATLASSSTVHGGLDTSEATRLCESQSASCNPLAATSYLHVTAGVAFETHSGAIVMLQPHRCRRDNRAQQHLAERIAEMQACGVEPSPKNLQRLGFGASTIQVHRKRVRCIAAPSARSDAARKRIRSGAAE